MQFFSSWIVTETPVYDPSFEEKFKPLLKKLFVYTPAKISVYQNGGDDDRAGFSVLLDRMRPFFIDVLIAIDYVG